MAAINGCPIVVLHLRCLLEMLSVKTVPGVMMFQIC